MFRGSNICVQVGIWVYISRADERLKTKIRTYREKKQWSISGKEVNKQDLKREKDEAWKGQHGMIRWQNKRGRCNLPLCALPSEGSAQFIPLP